VLQTSPAEHEVPHAPQLPLSVTRSRHDPEQSVSPVPHDVAHALELQTSPAAHEVPHAPQFALSVTKSRHEPEQCAADLACRA